MITYTADMSFDTHSVIKQLVDAGMPEVQAEIIVLTQSRLIDERLATKQDIALVQQDIEGIHKDIEAQRLATQKDIEVLRSETKKDIETLRAETKLGIETLRAEMKQDIALVQQDIKGIHKDIEALRSEMKQDIAGIHKDIALLSSQLTVRMGGMLVAAVSVLGTLQVLFLR